MFSEALRNEADGRTRPESPGERRVRGAWETRDAGSGRSRAADKATGTKVDHRAGDADEPRAQAVKFLHFDVGTCRRGAVVRVALSGTAANVMLLDDLNLSQYKAGHAFEYFGGHVTRSPVLLTVPHQGHWTVVVDLGGCSGQVNARVSRVA